MYKAGMWGMKKSWWSDFFLVGWVLHKKGAVKNRQF